MNTYILDGNDGQHYEVAADNPIEAALRLKRRSEVLDGYSVGQLVELMRMI